MSGRRPRWSLGSCCLIWRWWRPSTVTATKIRFGLHDPVPHTTMNNFLFLRYRTLRGMWHVGTKGMLASRGTFQERAKVGHVVAHDVVPSPRNKRLPGTLSTHSLTRSLAKPVLEHGEQVHRLQGKLAEALTVYEVRVHRDLFAYFLVSLGFFRETRDFRCERTCRVELFRREEAQYIVFFQLLIPRETKCRTSRTAQPRLSVP